MTAATCHDRVLGSARSGYLCTTITTIGALIAIAPFLVPHTSRTCSLHRLGCGRAVAQPRTRPPPSHYRSKVPIAEYGKTSLLSLARQDAGHPGHRASNVLDYLPRKMYPTRKHSMRGRETANNCQSATVQRVLYTVELVASLGAGLRPTPGKVSC